MPIKILCPCGADVTEEVSAYDKKTRSVHWFEGHALYCRACVAKAPAAARGNYAQRAEHDRGRRSRQG